MKVLVQIITGGRPSLEGRTTAKLLPELKDYGFTDIEWVIREDHVGQYEKDEHPFNVYSIDFASEYARTHWRHPTAKWEHGGFFGAFPGREWAMRSGKARGYDLVYQLDDNIQQVGLVNTGSKYGKWSFGLTSSILFRLAMSTNSHMTGMQLSSVVPPAKAAPIRTGFPYSVFVEKALWGRMPYYGPYEDDVMHSLEYGLHGGPHRTAAVVPTLTYKKESKSKTGMRAHYNHERGLELPRRYPKNASLKMSRSTSSPSQRNGKRMMRHFLNTRGYTPVIVTDVAMFEETTLELQDLVKKALEVSESYTEAKLEKRAKGE